MCIYSCLVRNSGVITNQWANLYTWKCSDLCFGRRSTIAVARARSSWPSFWVSTVNRLESRCVSLSIWYSKSIRIMEYLWKMNRDATNRQWWSSLLDNLYGRGHDKARGLVLFPWWRPESRLGDYSWMWSVSHKNILNFISSCAVGSQPLWRQMADELLCA